MSNEVIISALILLAAVVLAAVVLGRHFSLTKTASGSFVAKTDEPKSTVKVDKVKAGGSARITSEGNLEAGSIETRREFEPSHRSSGFEDGQTGMRPPQYISVRVRSKSAVRIGAISVVAAATGGLVAGRAVDILIGVIIGLIIALIVIILNKSDAEQAPPSRHNALTAIASFVIAWFFCRATESTDGSSVRKDASAKEDYNFRSAPEPTTKLQRSSRQQQSLHESTSGANTSARIEEAATKREDLSRRVCDGFSVRAVPNDNATFAVALLEIRASYSSGSTTVNAAEAMRVFCVYGHRHSCKMLNMDAPEKRPSPACLTTRDDPAKETLFLQILRRSFVDYSLSEKTTDDWNTMVTFDEIFEVVIYYIDKDQPSVAMSGFQVGSLLRSNGFIMGDLVSITASCEEELSLDLGSEN